MKKALDNLARWMISAPGRSVMDIHKYNQFWIVSLHDKHGDPTQAHCSAPSLQEAIEGAISNYYSQRTAIRQEIERIAKKGRDA